MKIESLSEKIKHLLLRQPRSRAADSHVFICCPFHQENTPSCSVSINVPNFLPGTFHCFGCDASGGWNQLADALDLDFKYNSADAQAVLKNSISVVDEDLLAPAPHTVSEFIKGYPIESFIEWPTDLKWRGLSPRFMKLVDAYLIYDRGEQQALFPVRVKGDIVGVVKAGLTEKRYIYSPGSWVKLRGLFPFDVAKDLMKYWQRPFVVLVEGPRDAGRLIQSGVPALSILGSKMWSMDKMNLILSLSDDELDVVTIFDNDRAGIDATAQVKKELKPFVSVKSVRLPSDDEKCDVFSLSKPKYRKLLKRLADLYGYG